MEEANRLSDLSGPYKILVFDLHRTYPKRMQAYEQAYRDYIRRNCSAKEKEGKNRIAS